MTLSAVRPADEASSTRIFSTLMASLPKVKKEKKYYKCESVMERVSGK